MGIVNGIRRHREAKAKAERVAGLKAQPANLYDLELATREAAKVPGPIWEVDRLTERVAVAEARSKALSDRMRELEER